MTNADVIATRLLKLNEALGNLEGHGRNYNREAHR